MLPVLFFGAEPPKTSANWNPMCEMNRDLRSAWPKRTPTPKRAPTPTRHRGLLRGDKKTKLTCAAQWIVFFAEMGRCQNIGTPEIMLTPD